MLFLLPDPEIQRKGCDWSRSSQVPISAAVDYGHFKGL